MFSENVQAKLTAMLRFNVNIIFTGLIAVAYTWMKIVKMRI